MGGAGPLIDPISVEIPPVGPPGGDATDVDEDEADHEKAAADLAAAQAELARLDQVEAEAQAALVAQGLQDRAGFRITEEGLVVVLFADDVFFASGSATIEPTGQRVVDTLAPVLVPGRRPGQRRGPRQPPARRRRVRSTRPTGSCPRRAPRPSPAGWSRSTGCSRRTSAPPATATPAPSSRSPTPRRSPPTGASTCSCARPPPPRSAPCSPRSRRPAREHRAPAPTRTPTRTPDPHPAHHAPPGVLRWPSPTAP